jgi:hypothetical protein
VIKRWMYVIVLATSHKFVATYDKMVAVCNDVVATRDKIVAVHTGSAKKMYTHFNRWYLCIVFEVELSLQYVV